MDDGEPFPFELPHRTRTRTASLRARREAWHPLNARPTRTCIGVPSHLHARTHRSSSSLRGFYLPALAGRPRQLHGPSATSPGLLSRSRRDLAPRRARAARSYEPHYEAHNEAHNGPAAAMSLLIVVLTSGVSIMRSDVSPGGANSALLAFCYEHVPHNEAHTLTSAPRPASSSSVSPGQGVSSTVSLCVRTRF